MEPIDFKTFDDLNVVKDLPTTVTIDDSAMMGAESFLNLDKLGENNDATTNINQLTSDINTLQPIELEPITSIAGEAAIPIGNTINLVKEEAIPLFEPTTFAPAPVHEPVISSEDELMKKGNLLTRIKNLREKKGVEQLRQVGMSSPLRDIQSEHDRMITEYKRAKFVMKWRNRIKSGATSAQFITKRMPRLGIKLDGFSEKIEMDMDEGEYDDDLEDFYDEMKDIGDLPAWLRLATGIGGAAFMVHLSNTMMKTEQPGIDEIAASNPELARNVAATIASQAGAPMTAHFPANRGPAVAAAGATGANVTTAAAAGARVTGVTPVKRREMQPPADVDDILGESMPAMTKNITVPSGSAMPSLSHSIRSTPVTHGISNGTGIHMMSDVDRASVHSGGSTRRGRRSQMPIGSAANIDI